MSEWAEPSETHAPPEPDACPDHLPVGRAATSGKMHILGRHGCLNAAQSAADPDRRPLTDLDRGETVDWCAYCEARLEIFRLRSELDAPDVGAGMSPVERAQQADLTDVRAGPSHSKGAWHLVGDHACPSVKGHATIFGSRPITALPEADRDWCYYCEMQLEALRLKASLGVDDV